MKKNFIPAVCICTAFLLCACKKQSTPEPPAIVFPNNSTPAAVVSTPVDPSVDPSAIPDVSFTVSLPPSASVSPSTSFSSELTMPPDVGPSHGSDQKPSGFDIVITNEHYEYESDSEWSSVSIDYPQIGGHPDKLIQEMINERLKKQAFMDYFEEDAELTTFEMECGYKLLGRRFLVTKFHLFFYHQQAAHPWSYLKGMTIDLKTGETLNLADIIAIDGRLQQKILNMEFTMVDGVGTMEEMLELSVDSYWSLDEQINSGGFYLTEDSLGLIFEVPHYIGDYWTLEISYEDIGDLFRPWLAGLLY